MPGSYRAAMRARQRATALLARSAKGIIGICSMV
jgi:hypothetical protein